MKAVPAVAAVALYGCWALQGVGGEIRALVDVRVRQVGQARDIKDHLNIVARGVRMDYTVRNDAGQTEEVAVLRDFDLDIRDGEFLSVLGPSGCGKSTFLSILAGLTERTGGNIRIDGNARVLRRDGNAIDGLFRMRRYQPPSRRHREACPNA